MELKIPQEYIIAARLVDPTTRCQVDFDQGLDWSNVLKVLIKNRVPLNSLKNDLSLKICPLVLNADFQNAEHAETLIGESLRNEYGELRQALLQKGIPSILFKSSGLLPSFPYTSDNLDTLVQPQHIRLSRQVLNALGYVELRNIEEPKKWLFRKFRCGESISAIHLHGLVGWGVPFLDDTTLWKRARLSEDDPWVMIPSPEDAFLAIIAHAFYENKSFKLLDIARIRHCLRQENLDFSDIQRIARDRGWEEGLAFCLLLHGRLEVALYGETLIPCGVLDWSRSIVSANAWLSQQFEKTLKRDVVHFPFRVSFIFGKILYYKKVLNDLQRTPVTRIYDAVVTFIWGVKHKLRISGQRGMIISLSGIDGAGKTIHSQSLVKAFETSEVKARIYWSRIGSSAQEHNHQDTAKRPSIDIAQSLAHRRQRLHNSLLRLGWLILNLTIFIVRCNLHVRFPRWLGGVVICDRYIYDAMVEIQASLPNYDRWSQWAKRLLILSCPRPDIAWLLDVPAELSIERQANEKGSKAACEELSKQRLMFKSLASTYGLRVLPTNIGSEETSTHVVRETLLKYYENYGTWVRAFMLSNPNQLNPEKGG
jgi:thymidylate kinase